MTGSPSRLVRRAAQVEADVHVPVAIVGGGACGLTAALMLADAGVECVVLERDALPSGSTALSSGFIPELFPGAGTLYPTSLLIGAVLAVAMVYASASPLNTSMPASVTMKDGILK